MNKKLIIIYYQFYSVVTNDTNQESEPLINRTHRTYTNLSSSLNENNGRDNEIHLRAKLRFFFMSPYWKWYLKRQCPWKAWFQFLKIIIVTTQVDFFLFT